MAENIMTAGYNAALSLLSKGWVVIPVHGVDESGRCTCGRYPCGDDNRNAGKHPVHGGWQKSYLPSPSDAYTIWIEDGPLWNVGVLTGAPSGFFALDIDPKNGGDEQLAKLIAQHGELPRTYTVRTGSGGRHYYFRLPDWDVRNSNGRITDGIDVRGTGGQVIAAGSTSGIGGYVVEEDAEIVEAPAWLLEMIPKGGSSQAVVVIEDLPAQLDLDPETASRVQRYAETVINNAVSKYVHAPSGSGNEQLFTSACKVLEIVQSPWNVFTTRDALNALEAGRKQRIALSTSGGGQAAEEFSKTFASAQRCVVGQGHPMPEDRTAGVLFDHPLLARPEVGDTPGKAEAVAEPAVDEVTLMLGKMLTVSKLKTLPKPQHLVQGLLDLDSESWLIAEPGGFKSFIAIDIAAHVASGRPWRGRLTRQGAVVYMAAEGVKGISLRVEAWEKTYGEIGDHLYVYPEPVQVADASNWAYFVRACTVIKPALIVLDTQARISLGLDENSASDIGHLIEAVRRLKAATGACVLVIHHVGRNGHGARGSSALDAAQDTEIRVKRPEARAKRELLTCTLCLDKQKDGSESGEIPLQMQVVQLGLNPETGKPYSSLAVKAYDPFIGVERPEGSWKADLSDNCKAILAAMQEHLETDREGREVGVSVAELTRRIAARATEGIGKRLADTSIRYGLVTLCKTGTVESGWLAYRGGTERSPLYYLSDPEAGD